MLKWPDISIQLKHVVISELLISVYISRSVRVSSLLWYCNILSTSKDTGLLYETKRILYMIVDPLSKGLAPKLFKQYVISIGV